LIFGIIPPRFNRCLLIQQDSFVSTNSLIVASGTNGVNNSTLAYCQTFGLAPTGLPDRPVAQIRETKVSPMGRDGAS
jgi:hypothetical protein